MTSHPDNPIQLVIFDWAGTVVDYGSQAPVFAFDAALSGHGIELTHEQIRGPMGLHKKDHIRELLSLESASQQWQQNHGRDWSEEDVEMIYEAFLPLQIEEAGRLSDLVPGTLECFDSLKQQGLLVGSSTGYPRTVAEPTIDKAAAAGFTPDCTVCADEVPAGRPAPWMIYRNMEQLGVFPPSSVLKVGDTVPDIAAACNAGVRSVGITRSGSEVGRSEAELETLSPDDQASLIDQAAKVLLGAGAEAVLESVADLPAWLDSQAL